MSDGVDLGAVVRTVARVTYEDLVTVVTTSLLFVAGSLPVVTLGAATHALVEVWTEVTLTEGRGGPVTERERVRLFVDTYRESLRAGVPTSLVLVAVVAVGAAYFLAAATTRLAVFVLWAFIGGYVAVIAVGLALRAASIRRRAVAGERPGAREAYVRAVYSFLEVPSITVLTLSWFAVLSLSLLWLTPAAFAVLGPSLLAISEVVVFEELFGEGAGAIGAAYRGDVSPDAAS